MSIWEIVRLDGRLNNIKRDYEVLGSTGEVVKKVFKLKRELGITAGYSGDELDSIDFYIEIIEKELSELRKEWQEK